MNEGLRRELEEKFRETGSSHAAAEDQIRRWSRVRLLLFLVALVGWITAIYLEDWRPFYASLVPVLMFILAVGRHEGFRRRSRFLKVETDLLAEKIGRARSVSFEPVHSHEILTDAQDPLNGGYRPNDRPEDRFRVGAYTRKDLDLCDGPANLRDLLDSTQTSFGFRRLHRSLLEPLIQRREIRLRQEAVMELREARDLRWEASRCFHSMRKNSLNDLTEFLRQPLSVAPNRALERLFFLVAPLPGIGLLGYAFGLLPEAFAVLFVTLAAAVVLLNLKKVVALRPTLYRMEPWCAAMERFCELQENVSTGSELLRQLQEEFRIGATGDRGIRWSVLRRRIGFLRWGDYGVLSLILNVLTLWDLHLAARIERGLKEHQEEILNQASAFGEWEMLAAFANLHEEQGDYSFPDFVPGDETAAVEIRAGAHPYIERDVVVSNDVKLGADRNLLVVTGSNMAGKSTFLKSICLNLILAQIGAPVRARKMVWSPVRLFTVIDVEDDLVHGFSYFRVEVDRVKEVLEAVESHPNVLAVFDELFRGTNSTERVLAGKEILRSLARTSGLFVMATHDMEYAGLPDEIPSSHNIHFAEDVSEKGVQFTYRVKPGPSKIRNALRVLEYCGIPTDIIERARAGLSQGGQPVSE